MTLLLYSLLAFSPIFLPFIQTSEVHTPDKSVEVVDFDGLQEYLTQFEDKTVVINFWATWCVPCVKELPYFEQATEKYANDDVAVVLVSLDFKRQIDTRLKPFVEKRQLKSHVVVLDDPDANKWIDKVHPDWSGAIPATLIRKGNTEAFYEKTFHSYEELDQIIQPFLNSRK